MSRPGNRVIGVGNLLMSDDGLGIVAVEQLRNRKIPISIELIDAGCGGLTLLQLLEDCKRAVIIDAADFGEKPGSILRLPAEKILEIRDATSQASLHQTGLAEVIALAGKLEQLPELVLFLVQPQKVERGLELSLPVQQALPKLLDKLEAEVTAWQND